MTSLTMHKAGQRPCGVERKRIGPPRLSLADRLAVTRLATDALNVAAERYPANLEEVGQAFVKVGARAITAASDAAGAQSFLGKHSGTISPLKLLSAPRKAADALFERLRDAEGR